MDQHLQAFLTDTYTSLENLRSALRCLSEAPGDAALFEAMRLFHSMSSSSSMMGFTRMASVCADQEHAFKELHEVGAGVSGARRQDALAAVDGIRAMLETIKESGPGGLR